MLLDKQWFFCPLPRENASLLLFCFPYAGGSAYAFRAWAKGLPSHIDVVIVKLPGRDSRIKEPAFSDWNVLLEALEKALLPHLNKPYAFFGHSFGARIAFELTKRFQEKNYLLPIQLFVSGCRCPHIPTARPYLHDLPKADFFQRVFNMNGTSAEILANPSLMELLEPTMRADMKLSELWADSKTPVNVPIAAFSGIDDPIDPPKNMQAWALYTQRYFSFHPFVGDHFFLHTNEKAVLNEIAMVLQRQAATIHQLFEQHAATTPQAIALVYKDQQLTYEQLNQRANQLAHHLIKLGVKTDTVVGISLERSFEMVIAMLAILKAGGVYLPLDPSYPAERIAFMLQDSGASIVIDKNTIISLNESTANPAVSVGPNNLAYINYTSGSTGRPKGVAIMHQSVVYLLLGASFARLNKDNVILQLATFSFDAITFELWGALLHGASCVLFAAKLPTLPLLRETIEKNNVTTLFLTTALFNIIIDEDPTLLSSVKQVLTGGESHSVRHMQRALSELPKTEIISVYGPTETTTFATYYPVRHIEENVLTIPIGRPLNHAQIYILDDNLKPVSVNEVGELCIGGAGLARGYVNNANLTNEKFIDHLSFLPPNQRLYKSGDLAKLLPDGNITFMGRKDNQVKIHGFRIELGEIEALLTAFYQVKQAAVVVHNTAAEDKKLVAYMTAKSEKKDINELRHYLKEKLPSYMIPSNYIWMDALPLTNNGKINRKELGE